MNAANQLERSARYFPELRIEEVRDALWGMAALNCSALTGFVRREKAAKRCKYNRPREAGR